MRDDILKGHELDVLRGTDLTYAEVGSTGSDAPSGYQHLRRSLVVGAGWERFRGATTTLFAWDMHRSAGVAVRPSDQNVVEGAVAVLRLGRGVLSVDAPVRVVYVVDEPTRKGFAYGTLAGHPECGEESFVLEVLANEEVRFTITVFSRPATLLARLSGPLGSGVQNWVTNRYLHAV